MDEFMRQKSKTAQKPPASESERLTCPHYHKEMQNETIFPCRNNFLFIFSSFDYRWQEILQKSKSENAFSKLRGIIDFPRRLLKWQKPRNLPSMNHCDIPAFGALFVSFESTLMWSKHRLHEKKKVMLMLIRSLLTEMETQMDKYLMKHRRAQKFLFPECSQWIQLCTSLEDF